MQLKARRTRDRGGALIYRSGERIEPYQVRAATFSTRRWRGLDPDEVYAYLREVADEMDRLLREGTTARTETGRIREGLRQWRSRHVGCRFADPEFGPGAQSRGVKPDPRPRNGGRW